MKFHVFLTKLRELLSPTSDTFALRTYFSFIVFIQNTHCLLLEFSRLGVSHAPSTVSAGRDSINRQIGYATISNVCSVYFFLRCHMPGVRHCDV